jgi:hypothetical protein
MPPVLRWITIFAFSLLLSVTDISGLAILLYLLRCFLWCVRGEVLTVDDNRAIYTILSFIKKIIVMPIAL